MYSVVACSPRYWLDFTGSSFFHSLRNAFLCRPRCSRFPCCCLCRDLHGHGRLEFESYLFADEVRITYSRQHNTLANLTYSVNVTEGDVIAFQLWVVHVYPIVLIYLITFYYPAYQRTMFAINAYSLHIPKFWHMSFRRWHSPHSQHLVPKWVSDTIAITSCLGDI